jgi:uridine kinase
MKTHDQQYTTKNNMTVKNIAAEIMKNKSAKLPILTAIEGYGGSGKSTFAAKLALELGDAYVIGIDDFIVKEKFTDPSWDTGSFDRVRLENQVLKPLRDGNVASYQQLIWESNSLSSFIYVPKVRYVIVEGISSYHPKIAHYYDYKIWVDTPLVIAKERGHARDGSNENAQHWDLWAENDRQYREKYHPEKVADFTFDNEAQLNS